MAVAYPSGMFRVPGHVSSPDRAALSKYIDGRLSKGLPLLVTDAVEFVPFPVASLVPDAICLYCASANLSASYECRKCGAPLVRQ